MSHIQCHKCNLTNGVFQIQFDRGDATDTWLQIEFDKSNFINLMQFEKMPCDKCNVTNTMWQM